MNRSRRNTAAYRRAASGVLFLLAALSYVGVLMQARAERQTVVDPFPYAERFGSDAATVTNAQPDAPSGTVLLGIDLARPSSAG